MDILRTAIPNHHEPVSPNPCGSLSGGAVVSETLAERNKTHGDWSVQSVDSQTLKTVLHEGKNWGILTSSQKEALEMICVKMSRLLNGNPNEPDTWHDIAGYASLAEKECLR